MSTFKTDTISSRVLFTLLSSTLLFAVINIVILQGTILPTFSKLEYEEGHKDISRVSETINREIHHLSTLTSDYAVWSDTWEYCLDRNEEFQESNLQDETLLGSELNYLSIMNLDREVIWSKLALHINDGEELEPFTSNLLPTDTFAANSTLIPNIPNRGNIDFEALSHSGIITLPQGFLLIAAHPVIQSSGEGPSHGTIMMGRLLDEELLEKIIDQTSVPFKIIPMNNISSDEKLIMQSFTDSEPTKVELRDGNLFGYTLFNDIEGKPAFLIECQRNPSIIDRGKQTVRWALILVTLSLGITIMVILYLIHRLFVLPLTSLTQEVDHIEKKGNFEDRVNEKRHDEIGILARSFNAMLKKLFDQHEELRLASIFDDLTQVYNRKHIFTLLENEVLRFKRYKHDMSIMMVDIDFFKQVNDTYGHEIGDEVLRKISESFLYTLRETDLVGRYGGEEFLMLLPDQGGVGARCAAERLRRGVEKLTFSKPDLKVTVSIGLYTFEQELVDKAITIADENLYKAKEQGRNRTVVNSDIAE